MTRALDDVDAKLLTWLQAEVPLVERPYAALGEQAGLSEQETVARVAALKQGQVIRQISAIFDSRALGYQSTLVAAQVAEERIHEAAAIINRHPGVSHNYRRNHAFNLWYTLAVPPDSRLGLEQTIAYLHQQSGAMVTRMMPTLRLFKIGVKFDLTREAETTDAAPAFSEADRQAADTATLTAQEKRLIQVLQQDLPATTRPFDAWAAEAQVSVESLLAGAKQLAQQHRMRRFSAVLRHREVGFKANGMGVWVVAPEQREAFGKTAARFRAVSHCYERPTYEDWPYSMFTMVHGTSQAACEGTLRAIAAATGVEAHAALYSSEEFKKTRVKYFVGDVEAWEAAAVGARS